MWARRGHRPVAGSRRKYEWGYLYGFVHPNSGRTVSVVGTSVSAGAMSAVLAHFAKEVGAGPTRRIALVLDGAGWHSAADLVVPDGIHLVFLPPYSPELQPAERLWPLINEVVANRNFRRLADLVDTIDERCRWLDGQVDAVRALTRYHWWADDIAPFAVEP